MNKHTIRMLIGCVLPLLLIFLLPVFGITNSSTLVLIFLVVMLLCHVMMPMHYGKHDHQDTKDSSNTGGLHK